MVDPVAGVMDSEDPENFSPRRVRPADRKQKFLSGHEVIDPFTAALASMRGAQVSKYDVRI